MRIMGIDPGLATLGFAFLDVTENGKRLVEFGVIRTPAHTPRGSRLQEIYKDLSSILHEFKPDICSIEQLFFSKNVTTGMQVAEARGVILLAVSEAGVPCQEYSPSAMKLALTGDGKADKQMVQKMVKLELGLNALPQPDDAADALSLALALSAELRYHQLDLNRTQ